MPPAHGARLCGARSAERGVPFCCGARAVGGRCPCCGPRPCGRGGACGVVSRTDRSRPAPSPEKQPGLLWLWRGVPWWPCSPRSREGGVAVSVGDRVTLWCVSLPWVGLQAAGGARCGSSGEEGGRCPDHGTAAARPRRRGRRTGTGSGRRPISGPGILSGAALSACRRRARAVMGRPVCVVGDGCEPFPASKSAVPGRCGPRTAAARLRIPEVHDPPDRCRQRGRACPRAPGTRLPQ